ncbi:MAG: hypothetical protein JWO35_132 [Candidatus Saccharibacteria bacterium]|nr:hypothetical protein [Candidatus Saccharibacteria bacterium]
MTTQETNDSSGGLSKDELAARKYARATQQFGLQPITRMEPVKDALQRSEERETERLRLLAEALGREAAQDLNPQAELDRQDSIMPPVMPRPPATEL